MPERQEQYPEYMRAGDVAQLLHVSPKTVARWASEGKLGYTRTLGGHRRFSGKAVRELAERLRLAGTSEADAAERQRAMGA